MPSVVWMWPNYYHITTTITSRPVLYIMYSKASMGENFHSSANVFVQIMASSISNKVYNNTTVKHLLRIAIFNSYCNSFPYRCFPVYSSPTPFRVLSGYDPCHYSFSLLQYNMWFARSPPQTVFMYLVRFCLPSWNFGIWNLTAGKLYLFNYCVYYFNWCPCWCVNIQHMDIWFLYYHRMSLQHWRRRGRQSPVCTMTERSSWW